VRRETAHAAGSEQGAPGLHDLLIELIGDTGAHIGALYLLDDDRRILLMDAEMGFPTTIAKAWARLRVSGPVPVAVALRERRLVWLADQEDLAREFPGAALALPYHFSAAAAPIRSGREDWGAVLLLSPAEHTPRPAERTPRPTERTPRLDERTRDVIDRGCARMAAVLQQASRLGQPVRPRHRPLFLSPYRSGRHESDAGLAALDCLNGLPEGYCALDIDGRMTFLTPPAAELLGKQASQLLGERPWEALPWLSGPLAEDRYRATVIGHQVTSYTAQRPDGQWLAFQLYPAPSGISVRVTPGTMARDPGHQMPDSPVGARWLAGTTAHHEMLHLVTTLSQAATVQDVVDLVADQVMPVFGVDAMALLTIEGGRLRIIGSRGYTQRSRDRLDGRPLAVPTPDVGALDTEPGFYATFHELRLRYPETERFDDTASWAVLPLITSGRAIGTCVLAYNQPHHFMREERATLTSLAGLIAQALERARMYDAKHELAQSLQEGLLPRALPRLPGLEVAARYVPATHGMDIGGDFYDLIHLDENTAAAVIGDVQGHDPTAAALMGQARTAIHAYATAGASPGRVLSHTNRLLMDLAPNRFTSCLYVCLDLKRQTACVASAGHLPPLLCVPGSPGRILGSPPGLLLGIDADADYPVSEHPLTPGSVLALYTDGLIETPDNDVGEAIEELATQFGLSCAEPLQKLADILIHPIADIEHRTDDTALLLVRPT